jgi:uncharacterized protein (DUF433 family)
LVTTVLTTQIELDARGLAWIAGTRVKVVEIVLDKLAHGWSSEEIHFQHPNLSMAQIHAALTYYYENQAKLDEQIREGLKEAAAVSAQLSDESLRRRLIDLQRSH